MAAPEPVDYYELLAIEQGSDGDGIRQAVLEQRRKWLRRQNAPSVERQRQAEDQLRAIAAAEQELLDPARREVYDRQLRESLTAKRRPTPPPAVTHQPPAPPPPPPEPAIDWIGRASAELQRGDYRSARYAAGEATERRPRDPAAWSVRGAISRAQNRFDDAVFEYTEATRLDSTPGRFVLLGQANEAAGYWQQALAAYGTAADMEPTESAYKIAMAEVWMGQYRPDQAISLLEPAQTTWPLDREVGLTLARALSAQSDLQLTLLNNNTLVFTSVNQINRVTTDLTRALSMSFDDDALRLHLQRRLGEAHNASLRTWSFPVGVGCAGVGGRVVGWLFALYLALAVPISVVKPGALAGFIGVALGALVIWTFFRAYRKPGWAANAARNGPYVQRWGI
ncbi:MAG TPA: tetratricopeptide repeat protein [Nakamurella sp.]